MQLEHIINKKEYIITLSCHTEIFKQKRNCHKQNKPYKTIELYKADIFLNIISLFEIHHVVAYFGIIM